MTWFKVLSALEEATRISPIPLCAIAWWPFPGSRSRLPQGDIPVLMAESKEGITGSGKIVQDLKDFSRVDSNQEWQFSDLHQGIDSTLNIVASEIKYAADVVKEYGIFPKSSACRRSSTRCS